MSYPGWQWKDSLRMARLGQDLPQGWGFSRLGLPEG